MYKNDIYTVIFNERIADKVYLMRLSGDTQYITNPGTFINIKIDGLFLRRPISVCDCKDGVVTIIYKVVGKGTEIMANMQAGTKLDVLTGLGNGFNTKKCRGENALVIGGGVGVPPMYMTAKKLIAEGKKVTAILGFASKNDVFFVKEFEEIGCKVIVTTNDGSYGIQGFVTDAMKTLSYDYLFTCGPEPMLKAVYNTSVTEGQFSFEERMGCGFGACMGCTCKTKYGNKRICRDGPVLKKEEVIW